ncbi:MAG: amylo-alpha-1,6-glucosidase [Gemmatimonadota bacterium]|nr:amylo-alpha-1,6-glucosidase [Gemmatimonadota bacterium]
MKVGAERLGAEWLEADGLGGFASGTVGGVRTRRYHALLLASTTPPAGRVLLVNGIEAWVDTPTGRIAISTQRYAPDVTHPDGATRLVSFTTSPWPTWRWRLDEYGLGIEQQVVVPRGAPVAALTWRLSEPRPGITLGVRPLLSGRDPHALHRENDACRFDAITAPGQVRWRPYPALPSVTALTSGAYDHAPLWFRGFQYDEERARGLDHIEDLASPGTFTWDLGAREAVLILAAPDADGGDHSDVLSGDASSTLALIRGRERARRAAFPSALHRAADAYVVRRGTGTTIVAGYPWFADWGRDSFIAVRGLCLATGRLEDARSILLEWTHHLSDGMLPNFFPEQGQNAEYNSVDASLWFIVAAWDLIHAIDAMPHGGADLLPPAERLLLRQAADDILAGYARGTRFGIRADVDGLLSAGETGTQLTWMDARADGREVTPRIGKPVEVQALWINALRIGSDRSAHWGELLARARRSFGLRFWNPARGCLYDVVDVDHAPGAVDDRLRPNQIFAVGGLPFPVIDRARARRLVDTVEAHLLTPLGLRSLAPREPGYVGRYHGGTTERDAAYHQGTVWPWLMGPFVEAWLRVRGISEQTKSEARRRFLAPLLSHVGDAGLGHLPEIADGDFPHAPRGCPFQAWSMGEALRLALAVLAPSHQR